MIRYIEVPMQHVGPAANVDDHRCSMGEHCQFDPAAPLGWVLHQRDFDEWASWHYPFVPADADPLDTPMWVCEDCACWIEDMWAMRELFVGLP
jgi:hypothetical protein